MNYFLNNPIPTAAEVMRKFADGGEVDYGDYGDYGESLMDLASVYGLRPTLEDRFVAASTPSPAPTITTSSGMTYYRWSDGTYNRNPESTGIRTPYDQLPPEYQAQDSRRPQQAAESGREGVMPTGEEAPLSTIPSIPDETGYKTEFINPPLDFSGTDAGLIPEAPPPAPMSGVSIDDREGIMPTGEEAPLTQPAAPVATPAFSYFDPGLTTSVTPTSSTFDAGQKAMALASLIDPTLIKGIGVGDAAFGGAGTSGAAVPDYFRAVAPDTVGGQGALYEEGALEAAKKAAVDPTQGLFKSGFEALAGQPGIAEAIQAKSERDLGALAKVESDYDVMKPISDLLKANKFEEAFAYAKEKGVVDKMMTPGWLEQLRQPFTPEEMKSFYKAIPPDYRGSEYSFNPDAAPVSETGYPEPLSAFQSKDKLTAIDAIIRLGGAAVLGAGALSALGGAGAAGGVGAAGGAGGAAGGAGAASAAGGAGGLSALTGVVPTGLVGAGGLQTFVVPAVAKGLTLGQILGGAALGGGALAAAAPGSSQIAAGYQPTQVPTTAPTVPQPIPDDLAEVVVQASKRGAGSFLGPGTLASTALMTPGSMSDIPTDIYGRVEPAPEVTEKPPETPAEKLEEVVVTGRRLPPIDLMAAGAIPALSQQLANAGLYQKPLFEDVPIKDIPADRLEEIVVQGSKPLPLDLIATGVGGLTAGQLMQGYTQPKVDPLTGEIRQPPKTVQELDAIQKALATGAAIPGTGGALDTIKSLLEKYGTLENALKILGAIGAAPVTTPTMPSLGGAGYDPRLGAGRGQWIDWEKVKADAAAAGMNLNTYVARNWNKIQNRALEAGMQSGVMPGAVPPTVPGSDTTQTPDVMVDPRSLPGGLNTMAMGGAPSRVRGPGSGRDDKIPALLSDGEYVIDAETMALLGDGSVDKAADLMDGFRENIRKHKGATLAKGGISPNAKSPLQYLRG